MTKKTCTLVICDAMGTEMEFYDFATEAELTECVSRRGLDIINSENCYDEDGNVTITSYAVIAPSRVYAITNPARLTHVSDNPEVCAFPTAKERDTFCAGSHGYYIPMERQPFGFDLYEIVDDCGTNGTEPEYYRWYMTTEPLVDVASDYADLLDIIEYDTIVD